MSLHWHLKGILENLAEASFNYVVAHQAEHVAYYVLDHYYDYSIKEQTRPERTNNLTIDKNLSFRKRNSLRLTAN